MAWLSASVMAQDFTSLFLTEHKQDTNLTCVTISPKMMQEIMKSDAEKDEEVLEIISNLKSMQLLTAKVEGQRYYNRALKIVEKNTNRFEPFLSFSGESENSKIMIRKNKGNIIELVMLIHEKNHFTIINFTGTMSPEFIAKLAASVKQKGS